MHKIILETIFFIAIVSFSFNASGQRKNVIMGDQYLENKQYTSAITCYTKALSNFEGEMTERNEIIFHLAECFRIINNSRKAEYNYQLLTRNKYAEKKPIVYRNYATVLITQGKYSDALTAFNLYLAKVPDDPLALIGKASCELGLHDTPDLANWTIKNVREINSTYDDFSAVYGDNKFKTVIFSSNRKGATGKDQDNWTNGYFSDLFIASKTKGESYNAPVLADLSGLVDTKANEGAAMLDDRFKKIYFTRCEKVHKGTEYCQILQADRKGTGWAEPIVIFKDTLGNVGHPAITTNGLTMIFSSNRPGGVGGKDLWKTIRPSLQKPFGPAVNLGNLVNTIGDELFPSLYADSVLYFASNGRVGLGGLDIYHVTLGKNGLSEVEHLPQPINSSADDFAISFEGNKQRGFFSSRRPEGKGGDDIYYFEKTEHKASIIGSVRDEVSKQPITLLPVFATIGKGDTIHVSTDNSGSFHIANEQLKEATNYTLIFSKESYFTKKRDVAIAKIKRDTVYHVNVELQPIPDQPIVLPDIYYELNKWDLKLQYQDSLMLLVNILRDNPTIVIELASHTDSRASTDYNDTLSLKRAETVVTFLTEKGVNLERLIAKGYGERIPRVLNTMIIRDGFRFESGTILTEAFILSIPDTKKREAAYQLNRRTEFSVIRKSHK